jgi:PAS domain S-box-containing protein
MSDSALFHKISTLASAYSSEWIIVKNPAGATVFVSPSCYQITGYSTDEFMNNPNLLEGIAAALPEDHKNNGIAAGQITKNLPRKQFSIIGKNGNKIHIGQRSFTERDTKGGVVYYVDVFQDITCWTEDYQSLCKSKEKYEKAFHKSSCIMGFSKLETGEFVEVNEAFTEVMNLTSEEVIGKRVTDILKMHEEKRAQYVERILKEGFLKNETIEIETQHGQKHILAYNAEVIKQEEDLMLISAFDVSELTVAKKNLLYYNSLYEILTGIALNYINIPFERIDQGILDALEKVGEFISADRAYLFNYDLDKSTASCTHEWCRDNIPAQIEQMQDIPLENLFEFQAHRTGEIFLIEDIKIVQNQRIKNELKTLGIRSKAALPLLHNGVPMGMIGFDKVKHPNSYSQHELLMFKLLARIIVNLRLRHKAQKALIESETRFRSLIENAPVLINAFDKNGKCMIWNKQCQETLGYSADEVLAHANPMELFYPDKDIRKAALEATTKSPIQQDLIWYAKTKHGNYIPNIWMNYRLPDGLIINIGRDITKQREDEKQKQIIETGYKFLFDNMIEGFVQCQMIYDQNNNPVDFTILKLNKAFSSQLHITPENLIGKNIKSVFPDLEKYWLDILSKVARNDQRVTFQKFFQPFNKHYAISAFSPMPGQFATIITDITKRKNDEAKIKNQIEEIVQYQNKLKKLNAKLINAEESERRKIAGFLHDDVGQLLSAAHLQLTSLAEINAPIDKQKQMISSASNLINQSIRLCRQMTYNLNTPILKQFGLIAALKWKLTEANKLYGIETRLEAHTTDFNFSESLNNLFFRVLGEIINNAIKHANCSLIRLEIKHAGDELIFSVIDNGIGFDFQKVMAAQEDTKYGLFSISERLMAIGGVLKVSSLPGSGANISIVLKQSNATTGRKISKTPI